MTAIPQILRILKILRTNKIYNQEDFILDWFSCRIRSSSQNHILTPLAGQFKPPDKRVPSFLANQLSADSLGEYSDIVNS